METAPITSAVVRLSATGEMTKDGAPVTQKSWRRERPRETSQARRVSKTPRSCIVSGQSSPAILGNYEAHRGERLMALTAV